MFTWIDAMAFLVCAAVWLGPLVYNRFRGCLRLAHPIGVFPLGVIYMAAIPMAYRLQDITMLRTSLRPATDPWFLAGPLLVLAGSGVFYFLGVKFAGVSLKLGPKDHVLPYATFPTIRNVSPASMFSCAFFAAVFIVLLKLDAAPLLTDAAGHGVHAFNMLFMSLFILPPIVMCQNQRLGEIFVLLTMALGPIIHSKAAFLLPIIGVVVMFQGRLWKASKLMPIIVAAAFIMTPVAVKLYTGQREGKSEGIHALTDSPSLAVTLATIFHREYAFEAFAIVYSGAGDRYAADGLAPNVWPELAQIIPSYIWPEKPVRRALFPQEYLPDDYREGIAYTQYLLTPWYLDFGVPGCCAVMFVIGGFFGYCYRKAVKKSLACHESWPMMLYLVALFMTHPLIGAGIPFSVTQGIGMTFGVSIVLFMARMTGGKRSGGIRRRARSLNGWT